MPNPTLGELFTEVVQNVHQTKRYPGDIHTLTATNVNLEEFTITGNATYLKEGSAVLHINDTEYNLHLAKSEYYDNEYISEEQNSEEYNILYVYADDMTSDNTTIEFYVYPDEAYTNPVNVRLDIMDGDKLATTASYFYLNADNDGANGKKIATEAAVNELNERFDNIPITRGYIYSWGNNYIGKKIEPQWDINTPITYSDVYSKDYLILFEITDGEVVTNELYQIHTNQYVVELIELGGEKKKYVSHDIYENHIDTDTALEVYYAGYDTAAMPIIPHKNDVTYTINLGQVDLTSYQPITRTLDTTIFNNYTCNITICIGENEVAWPDMRMSDNRRSLFTTDGTTVNNETIPYLQINWNGEPSPNTECQILIYCNESNANSDDIILYVYTTENKMTSNYYSLYLDSYIRSEGNKVITADDMPPIQLVETTSTDIIDFGLFDFNNSVATTTTIDATALKAGEAILLIAGEERVLHMVFEEDIQNNMTYYKSIELNGSIPYFQVSYTGIASNNMTVSYRVNVASNRWRKYRIQLKYPAATKLATTETDFYLGANSNGSGGSKVVTETQINQAITNLQDEIGIVINGNTAAIDVGVEQYVILKNSSISGVADGLYKYTGSTTKTAGNAFSSDELTAEPTGGLNALNSKIENVTTIQNGWVATKNGHIVSVDLSTATINGQDIVNQLPLGYRPLREVKIFTQVYNGSSYTEAVIRVNASGNMKINTVGSETIAGVQLAFLMTNPIVFMA